MAGLLKFPEYKVSVSSEIGHEMCAFDSVPFVIVTASKSTGWYTSDGVGIITKRGRLEGRTNFTISVSL